LDSYTEDYDYWSDSDLEDEPEVEDEDEFEAEDEEPAESQSSPGPEDTADLTTVPDYPSPHSSLGDTNEARNFDRSVSCSINGFARFWSTPIADLTITPQEWAKLLPSVTSEL
jgi:hypothetical protein